MSSEDDFSLNLFNDLLDSLDEDKDLVIPKRNVEQETQSLMDHIGGFEYWPDLNDDCKKEIARFLDPKSLLKLGVCSKSDNALVKKIPIHVNSISISDDTWDHYMYQSEHFDHYTVKIEFSEAQKIEFVFSQIDENTLVRWLKYIPKKRAEVKKSIIENAEYEEEAVKFAEKWMERCQYKMKHFSNGLIDYPIDKSSIKSFPNCLGFHLCADDLEKFRWWLEKVPEKMENVSLSACCEDESTVILTEEFLSSVQVMNASKHLGLRGRAGFSDEQFLKLKARDISFEPVNITEDGVNQFLKKWVNGKGIEGFKEVLLWTDKDWDQEKVTKDLTIRPWDEAFEYETRGFSDDFQRVCGRGEHFQISSLIDPFESITLTFHGNRLSIYKTGTRMIDRGGRTFTSYRIPSGV